MLSSLFLCCFCRLRITFKVYFKFQLFVHNRYKVDFRVPFQNKKTGISDGDFNKNKMKFKKAFCSA